MKTASGPHIAMGHVRTRWKSKSDFFAKRSGAAAYTVYFRLEDYFYRDTAAVAIDSDVIR
jgi:hypothetical protein